ncbi:MAG: hypothetical protein IJS89_02605 [Bacteroidaceae bacterium]|nr:hypothetical protein [Bacteroidaceae bacterium]
MKRFPFIALTLLAIFTACAGEDRSGEQPFAPVVRTLGAEPAVGDSVRMTGEVVESLNSTVTKRGFTYWNDTLKVTREAPLDDTNVFRAFTDSLGDGDYSYAAFATNGIGTSYGDTLTFTKG